MSLGAVLLAFAVLLLVLAYLARPFSSEQVNADSELSREQSALLAERERVLTMLEELEMDRAMGKVTPEAYELERPRWIQEGARILRKLDEVGVPGGYSPSEEQSRLEDALEARVQAMRDRLQSSNATQYCPACGSAVVATDQFCAVCGTSLLRQSDE